MSTFIHSQANINFTNTTRKKKRERQIIGFDLLLECSINLQPLYRSFPCQLARGSSLSLPPLSTQLMDLTESCRRRGEDRHTRWAYQLLLTSNRDNRETGKKIQRLFRCLAVQVTHTRTHTHTHTHTTYACIHTNPHKLMSTYTLSGMCVEAHMHCHRHYTPIS